MPSPFATSAAWASRVAAESERLRLAGVPDHFDRALEACRPSEDPMDDETRCPGAAPAEAA